jgi:DNA-binding response OmpR family regulator
VRRRQRAAEPDPDAVEVGELELLPGQFQATVAGEPLDLTRRAAVLQANATLRSEEAADDEEPGSGDERSEPDQAMTDAFRAFGG